MSQAKRLEENKVLRAVQALQAHVTSTAETKKKPQLLPDGDQFVFMIVALKKTSSRVVKRWPLRIPLRYKLNAPGQVEVCLFSKDDKPAVRKLLDVKGVKCITKVIPFSKLKTHYKTFERRRQLASMYDLFLVDRRISHLIINRLGKSFVQKKNHPYPVNLQKVNLVGEIEAAIGSTYLRLTPGGSLNIRIGRVSMPSEHVVDNIVTGMSAVVQHIPKGWSNVQAINLKTVASIALPIFNALPNTPTLLPQEEKNQLKQGRVVKLEHVEEKEDEVVLTSVDKKKKSAPQTPLNKSMRTTDSCSAKRVRGSRIASSKPKKRKSL